jgi:hypothetical protein
MKTLEIAVQTRLPVLLWGAPGVGKSSFVRALGEALGLPVEVVIASIREPSDFAGLPIINDGEVRMAPPAWARRLATAGKGILFLDEISTAPPAVQAALLRVVLDRVVGDLELPEGVAVVAAANPPEQAAGGWDLAAPLANRFVHLQWKVDIEKWCEGMIAGWPGPTTYLIRRLPENWRVGVPTARALVANFIKTRPALLLQVPKDEEKAGLAWPSPRTWDYAAQLWAACEVLQADLDVRLELIAGCVGEGPALEFLSWVKELDIPDPEEVIKDPKNFRLPDRGDKIYAVLSAVVAAVLRDLNQDRWRAGWEILATAANQGAPDLAAAVAKSLAQARRPEFPLPVQEVRAFLPVLRAAGLM